MADITHGLNRASSAVFDRTYGDDEISRRTHTLTRSTRLYRMTSIVADDGRESRKYRAASNNGA